jgi:hypothetical protein
MGQGQKCIRIHLIYFEDILKLQLNSVLCFDQSKCFLLSLNTLKLISFTIKVEWYKTFLLQIRGFYQSIWWDSPFTLPCLIRRRGTAWRPGASSPGAHRKASTSGISSSTCQLRWWQVKAHRSFKRTGSRDKIKIF